jgi:polyribonucleotide 5'-hydroxyl-kinase
MAAPPADATRHVLAKESELRVEVAAGGAAFFQLVAGTAEVFGVEAAEGRAYALAADRRVALFTWFGAEILLWGAVSGAYVSDESQVPLAAALHAQLDARRAAAAAARGAGPRVMIVGPSDSGKSTLARILAAYAVRVGRAPTLVDLDIGQGDVAPPGCVAAAALDRASLTCDEGFAALAPLVFYLGHATPGDVAPVYKNLVARLAQAVARRAAGSSPLAEAARAGGLIINTMGWVDGAGYALLLDAARAFAADVVVVMGHDRTFAALTSDLRGGGGGGGGGEGGVPAPARVTVVKLARPGGAVERARETRRDARAARLRAYFYGAERAPPGGAPALSPETLTLRFEDVTILRVGGAASDAGLVPIGRASALDPLRVTPVAPTATALLNQVLGVSFAATDKAVPHVNVAGFVHVRAVDAKAKTLTVLAPCGGALPSRFLILGANAWTETR